MRNTMLLLLAALLCALPAAGQTGPVVAGAEQTAAPAPAPEKKFHWSAEAKINERHSREVSIQDHFPFPPGFIPPGQNAVYLQTVSPGDSLEVSNLALAVDGNFTPDISGRAQVNVLDLYDRNPTSSDDRVFLRQAWLRFGHKYEALVPMPGTSFYLEAGKDFRFSHHLERPLESWGLWGTAVGRFEEIQIQAGGSFGKHIYWRGSAANGNPLFFRDTNALAGDNGTPERVPGNVHPIYQSGFPILYDTKASDLNPTGELEYGAGAGLRFMGPLGQNGVDILGWYFRRNMADSVNIRGTFYSGDLKLLEGNGISLPFSGREKIEEGGNVEWKLGHLEVFGQYVHQDIAHLVRQGVEAEAAFRIPLYGLFLSGQEPVINYIRPVVRFSNIHNRWVTPVDFVAPSVGWNWRKYDVGLRVGITQNVDLTAEYSRHDMITRHEVYHPDESLVTLRAFFGE